ncbi:transposase [Plasticicumulans sp.]|uniref:REP-associated tyrosine transposase n=2 Tax=Plasticicumulans sp. TaxID=2307179 RepID=UPI002CA12CDF|nr:transposase [Plasticicumulans sp.]HMZ09141.1 transposase [Plasticicumulans sp.]HMZ09157.1 transposase [Plasticicumulans sp.]HNK30713.1 transposase [Plasticicumulans sp.]HNM43564.1 transposase [Plasticicumulans sp.]HNO59416.1 transposase [Plasticicumulans sp.]
MRTCIRTRNKGGCYFFTVNLAERPGDGLLVRHVDHLRSAFRETRADHPFMIDAIVILPDHLHCIWQLPPDDDDYPTRWRLIKSGFSRRVVTNERVSESRQRKHERGLWQRRYWEHAIRDDEDYRQHLDYIHYNPVKHGLVESPKDWDYSSFRRFVDQGMYSLEWAANMEIDRLHLE